MTCIVGIVDDDGKVILGGDSAGSSGDDISVRTDSKIFRKGGMMFGCSGSFRIAQLIKFGFDIPDYNERSTMAHMVKLASSLRSYLKKEGAFSGEEMDASILIAYMGKLFELHSDFQIATNEVPYSAVGSGAAYALGSLFSSYEHGEFSAREALEVALKASEYNCASVKSPFVILM